MIGQSTSITEKKPEDQKNILEIFWLILGRFSFSFFLNVSTSQADYEYVPNYGFQCEGRPRAGSTVRNMHFLRFLPFEVICRPAPTRISEIHISGIQIV
jgi:hypothetical protein